MAMIEGLTHLGLGKVDDGRTLLPRVLPGEEIEVVFSIFDMSDASFDTVVLLDNVHWGCTDLPPVTAPQG